MIFDIKYKNHSFDYKTNSIYECFKCSTCAFLTIDGKYYMWLPFKPQIDLTCEEVIIKR